MNKIKKFYESKTDENEILSFVLGELYSECKGDHEEFLKYLNKAFNNRIIKGYWENIEHEIIFKETYIKTTLSTNNSLKISLYVIDNKDVHHLMSASDKIYVYKKPIIISKEDPYGEENWDD